MDSVVFVFFEPGAKTQVLAKQVAQGAAQAGALVKSIQAATASSETTPCKTAAVVFETTGALATMLDQVSQNNAVGMSIALVCVHNGNGRKSIEDACGLALSKGQKVAYSLAIEQRGMFRKLGFSGELTDSDLARAKAIGERLAYLSQESRGPPRSKLFGEKSRIPGYKK